MIKISEIKVRIEFSSELLLRAKKFFSIFATDLAFLLKITRFSFDKQHFFFLNIPSHNENNPRASL